MIAFYLALYNIGDSTTHHWCLVATDPVLHSPCQSPNLALDPVHTFQIVTTPSPSHPSCEDGYIPKHLTYPTGLPEPQRCICAVRLPDLNMTIPELAKFVERQPTGQRDTPLLQVPWKKWECSQWAIRVIKGLVEAGVVVCEAKNSFYSKRAVERGFAFWGQMMQVAGTKVAHDILAEKNRLHSPDGPGGLESMDELHGAEIRVVDLVASGIHI